MVFSVHFRRENRTIHVGTASNLRKACLESGLDPYPLLGGLLSCRGKGFCGTCAVVAEPAEGLSPPERREARWLSGHAQGLPGLRLSCQAQVTGDVTITTSPDTQPAWRQHTFYSGRAVRSWEAAAGSGEAAGASTSNTGSAN